MENLVSHFYQRPGENPAPTSLLPLLCTHLSTTTATHGKRKDILRSTLLRLFCLNIPKHHPLKNGHFVNFNRQFLSSSIENGDLVCANRSCKYEYLTTGVDNCVGASTCFSKPDRALHHLHCYLPRNANACLPSSSVFTKWLFGPCQTYFFFHYCSKFISFN